MTNKLTKEDTNKAYVRNFFDCQWGRNYRETQGLGCAWVTMPVSERLYNEDPVAMKKALKTYLGFMNTTPVVSYLVVGADIALEEETGIEDETATTGLKTGLMGLFAGVSDIIFITVYRVIASSITAYMAQGGQVVGLLIPLIVGAVALWVRYKFAWIGYHQGKKIATEFVDKIKLFTQGVVILGLTVVGGLIPSVITYKLDLVYKIGDVTSSVQEVLDKILPASIPLRIVFLSYWLLGKKRMSSTWLIFVLISIGMVLDNLRPMLAWVGGLS